MLHQKLVLFALVSLALLVLNVGAQNEDNENEGLVVVAGNTGGDNANEFEDAASQTSVDQDDGGDDDEEESESNEQLSRPTRAVGRNCRADRECSRGYVCTYVGRSLRRRCQPSKRRF